LSKGFKIHEPTWPITTKEKIIQFSYGQNRYVQS